MLNIIEKEISKKYIIFINKFYIKVNTDKL